MKIIIVGAGAVGSIVAQKLSAENHDVTLIESEDRAVSNVQRSLDALVLTGNGASWELLEEAGVERTDILIAVTNVDEMNILACQQASRYKVKTRVARVRNRDYYLDDKTSSFPGIDHMINPDEEAVREIHELLLQPAATDIYDFADGRVQVIGARVGAGAQVTGKTLKEIQGEVGSRWALVAAITRDGKSIIPRGDDRMLEGDHAFLVGRQGKISDAVKMLAVPKARPQHVMIVGGNRIGIRLAGLLPLEGVHVKLIEASESRAHRAGNKLDRALVIHGDATDAELLLQEAIGQMDAFVAVSDDEEMNLTSSLLARHHGAGKTIALIKRPNYVPLATVIGIDAAVSPRLSTARAIMRYFHHGNVLSATDLKDSEAEVLEMRATERSAVVGRPLATLEFPEHALVAAIIKPYQVVVPRGGDVIEPGDQVLVFTLPDAVRAVRKLFS
jgi:trk system potassium uptake protein TrkA